MWSLLAKKEDIVPLQQAAVEPNFSAAFRQPESINSAEHNQPQKGERVFSYPCYSNYCIVCQMYLPKSTTLGEHLDSALHIYNSQSLQSEPVFQSLMELEEQNRCRRLQQQSEKQQRKRRRKALCPFHSMQLLFSRSTQTLEGGIDPEQKDCHPSREDNLWKVDSCSFCSCSTSSASTFDSETIEKRQQVKSTTADETANVDGIEQLYRSRPVDLSPLGKHGWNPPEMPAKPILLGTREENNQRERVQLEIPTGEKTMKFPQSVFHVPRYRIQLKETQLGMQAGSADSEPKSIAGQQSTDVQPPVISANTSTDVITVSSMSHNSSGMNQQSFHRQQLNGGQEGEESPENPPLPSTTRQPGGNKTFFQPTFVIPAMTSSVKAELPPQSGNSETNSNEVFPFFEGDGERMRKSAGISLPFQGEEPRHILQAQPLMLDQSGACVTCCAYKARSRYLKELAATFQKNFSKRRLYPLFYHWHFRWFSRAQQRMKSKERQKEMDLGRVEKEVQNLLTRQIAYEEKLKQFTRPTSSSTKDKDGVRVPHHFGIPPSHERQVDQQQRNAENTQIAPDRVPISTPVSGPVILHSSTLHGCGVHIAPEEQSMGESKKESRAETHGSKNTVTMQVRECGNAHSVVESHWRHSLRQPVENQTVMLPVSQSMRPMFERLSSCSRRFLQQKLIVQHECAKVPSTIPSIYASAAVEQIKERNGHHRPSVIVGKVSDKKVESQLFMVHPSLKEPPELRNDLEPERCRIQCADAIESFVMETASGNERQHDGSQLHRSYLLSSSLLDLHAARNEHRKQNRKVSREKARHEKEGKRCRSATVKEDCHIGKQRVCSAPRKQCTKQGTSLGRKSCSVIKGRQQEKAATSFLPEKPVLPDPVVSPIRRVRVMKNELQQLPSTTRTSETKNGTSKMTTDHRRDDNSYFQDQERFLRSYFKKVMWYELPVAREEGRVEDYQQTLEDVAFELWRLKNEAKYEMQKRVFREQRENEQRLARAQVRYN